MILNRNYTEEEDDHMLQIGEEDDEEFTGGGQNIFECHDSDNNIIYNNTGTHIFICEEYAGWSRC